MNSREFSTKLRKTTRRGLPPGSLASTSTGRLTISWRASGDRIAVEWTESGGPTVTEPKRRSFGSNLIERSLDGFGGSAKIEFAPAGVVCRMQCPKPKTPVAPDSAARKSEVA